MRYIILLTYCWVGLATATSWDLIQKDLNEPFYFGVGSAHGQLSLSSDSQEWLNSAHLFAGYRFEEVWALEISGYRITEQHSWDQTTLPFESLDHDLGVAISLLGFAYYPDFSAYYRIGWQQDSYTLQSLRATNPGGCSSFGAQFFCSEEKKQKGWLLGLGTELPMSRRTAVRFEWRSHWGGEDFEYHQAMASLMVSF